MWTLSLMIMCPIDAYACCKVLRVLCERGLTKRREAVWRGRSRKFIDNTLQCQSTKLGVHIPSPGQDRIQPFFGWVGQEPLKPTIEGQDGVGWGPGVLEFHRSIVPNILLWKKTKGEDTITSGIFWSIVYPTKQEQRPELRASCLGVPESAIVSFTGVSNKTLSLFSK